MAIGSRRFRGISSGVQPAKPPLGRPMTRVGADPRCVVSKRRLAAKYGCLASGRQGILSRIARRGSDCIQYRLCSSQQLQLGVHVTCKDTTSASALLTQFETTTKALREALAHQHAKPDPADLSGVLVAGTFHRDERQVYGAWPIPRAFVGAIAGACIELARVLEPIVTMRFHARMRK